MCLSDLSPGPTAPRCAVAVVGSGCGSGCSAAEGGGGGEVSACFSPSISAIFRCFGFKVHCQAFPQEQYDG